MSPTSEFMAQISLAHSYLELFQVKLDFVSVRTIKGRSIELRGLYSRSYFGPRTCGGGITNVIEVRSGRGRGNVNVPFQGFARQCGIQVFRLYSTPSPVTENRNVDL